MATADTAMVLAVPAVLGAEPAETAGKEDVVKLNGAWDIPSHTRPLSPCGLNAPPCHVCPTRTGV